MTGMLKQLLTEDDADSVYDLWRVMPFIAMFVFFGCTIYAVYRSGVFDYLGFGSGCGTLLGGSGLGSYFKAKGGQ